MSRLDPNGDAFSRRHHYKPVKMEKEQEGKAEVDKGRKTERREVMDSKKNQLRVMEAASVHVANIGINLKRMMEINEQRAAASQRGRRIQALEKK